MTAKASTPVHLPFRSSRPVATPGLAGAVSLIAVLALIIGLALGVHFNSRYVSARAAEFSTSLEPPTSMMGTSSFSQLDPNLATPAVGPVSGNSLLDNPTFAAIAPTSERDRSDDGSGGGGFKVPALSDLKVSPELLKNLRLTLSADGVVGLLTTIGGWGVSASIATANISTGLLGDLIIYSAYAGNGNGILGGLQNLLPKVNGTAAAATALPGVGLPKLASAAPALKLPSVPRLGVKAPTLLSIPKVPKVPHLPKLPRIFRGIPFVPFI